MRQWVDNCRLRANSTLGSSVWYEKNQRTWQLERSGVDFFDADPSRNPLMHDWNWVYLVYCDGELLYLFPSYSFCACVIGG